MASQDVSYWPVPPHPSLPSHNHPYIHRRQSTAKWAANLLIAEEAREYEDILDIVDAYGYDDDDGAVAGEDIDNHDGHAIAGIDSASTLRGSDETFHMFDYSADLTQEIQTATIFDDSCDWNDTETDPMSQIPVEIADDTSDVLPSDDYIDDTQILGDKEMNDLLKELDECQLHVQSDNKSVEQESPRSGTYRLSYGYNGIYNDDGNHNDYSAITERIDRFLESQVTFVKGLNQSPSAIQERDQDTTLVTDNTDMDDSAHTDDLTHVDDNSSKTDGLGDEDLRKDDSDGLEAVDEDDEYESDEEESDLTDRRRAALREMLTTERSYVKSLKRLCECFLYPLRSVSQHRKGMMSNVRKGLRAVRVNFGRSDRNGYPNPVSPGSGRGAGCIGGPNAELVPNYMNLSVSEPDIRLIFGNIETILALHKRILRQMEERHREWSPESNISDIFKHLLQAFPQYQTYVENFTNATTTLERLAAQSSQFAKFINGDQGSINSMNLKAYISLPLRRVTRYITYMTNQIDLLPPSHEDCDTARNVFGQLSHSTNTISACILESENRLRLKSLEQTISGLPGRISYAPRRLIHLGALQQFRLGDDGSSKETRFAILLDDRIIWTRETQPERYTFKDQIMLNGAFVTDLADTALYENAFRVVGSSGKEALFCAEEGQTDKSEWLEHIQVALNRPSGDVSGFSMALHH